MREHTTEQQDRAKVRDKRLHDRWSFLVFLALVVVCVVLHYYQSVARTNYDAATVCRVVKTLERQEQYGYASYVEVEYVVNGRTLNAERPKPANVAYAPGDCFAMRYVSRNPSLLEVDWSRQLPAASYGH